MRVKNVPGTKRRKPKNGAKSHTEDYINETNSTRFWCSTRGCPNPVEVAAHVRKAHGNARRSEYLVLLCKACNAIRDASFELKRNVTLVTVRTS